MSDLLSQNFATVQSNQQPTPVTVAIAETIAPTGFYTIVSGSSTETLATITPPVTGVHMLAIQLATTNGLTTSGNITGSVTTVANQPALFVYNPITAKYRMVQG